MACSLILKRFVFVAWYPAVVSFLAGSAFAASLLPKRAESLCYAFALSFSRGIVPDGASIYCRRLTKVWWAVLWLNAAIASATVFAPVWVWVLWNCALSYAVMGLVWVIEFIVREHSFSVSFSTSGSTGRSKGVVKSFAALAKEVAMHRDIMRETLKGKPLFLSTVDPSHMYGTLWRVMLPKAAGCEVHNGIIRTPEELMERMSSAPGVVLVTTPSFLAHFTKYAQNYEVPQNAVEIVTSGALLTAEVSAAAKRVFSKAPLEIFGSTETGGVAWRRQESGESEWKVFDRVKIRLSQEGTIEVKSPFSFRRGWYSMGDGVELGDGARTFRLLGRRDRIAKIAEERIDLLEMERLASMALGGDEVRLAVLEGESGPILGAVVAGKSRPPLEMRSTLLKVFPKGTVPRRYRFVNEIPRNEQGKIVDSAIKALFSQGHSEGPVRISFSYGESAPFFDGHFPGFAILPGVVQIGRAVKEARKAFGFSAGVRSVKKVKFMHPIRPGDMVNLVLVRKAPAEVSYRMDSGDIMFSSGVIVFGEGEGPLRKDAR